MSDRILVEKLNKRIHNLEIALMTYVALTKDLLPPNTDRNVDEMMEDFFNNSESIGAFKSDIFQGDS